MPPLSEAGRNRLRDYLVGPFIGRLRGYCWRILGDSELADDAATDAICTILRIAKSEHGDDPQKYDGWFLVIARNAALNIRRREYRANAGRSYSFEELAAVIPAPERDDTPGDVEKVLQLLGQLPPATRDAVLLHCRDGWTYEKIAAELGMSAESVGRLVRGTLDWLRDRLGVDGK